MNKSDWMVVGFTACSMIVFLAFMYFMTGYDRRPREIPPATSVEGRIVVQDINGCTWMAAPDGSTNLVTLTAKCRDLK